MSKYTKGPWRLDKRMIIAGRWAIALIKNYDGVRGMKQEQEANASLMACAPELLNMLIRVTNTLSDPSIKINVNEIYQLIAKAKGEKQEDYDHE